MPKLYLDTSTDTCIVRIDDKEYSQVLGHDMAEKLLSFISTCLKDCHSNWSDISEVTYFSGPGSFTGLRIGAAIVNTLTRHLQIPLFDHHGQKHQVILPEYAHPANISKPRK